MDLAFSLFVQNNRGWVLLCLVISYIGALYSQHLLCHLYRRSSTMLCSMFCTGGDRPPKETNTKQHLSFFKKKYWYGWIPKARYLKNCDRCIPTLWYRIVAWITGGYSIAYYYGWLICYRAISLLCDTIHGKSACVELLTFFFIKWL